MILKDFIKTNKPTVLYFFVAILSITFLTSEITPYIKTIRSFFIYFLSPVHVSIAKVIDYPTNTANNFIKLIYLKEENIKLKQQLHKMYLYKLQQEQLKNDYLQYKSSLELKNFYKLKEPVYVNILVRDYLHWYNYIIISGGKNYALEEDMPLITNTKQNKFYLVGRLWQVEEKTSKVLLITDQMSAIPVKIKGKNIQGVLLGNGTPNPTLEYVLIEDNIQIGDSVITSGILSNMPENIEIGTVTSVEITQVGFKSAKIKLFYNINGLDNLIVLK
ncbi:MAG: rod shape-determining protein MreC [Endomicrobiia bacterium]